MDIHEIAGWEVLAIFPCTYSHGNGTFAYLVARRFVDLAPLTRLHVSARVNDLSDAPEDWREVTVHVNDEAALAQALTRAGWSGVARALDVMS
jgi:hypothetical protein